MDRPSEGSFPSLTPQLGRYAGDGKPLANGAYIYVITATDGTHSFIGRDKLFVIR